MPEYTTRIVSIGPIINYYGEEVVASPEKKQEAIEAVVSEKNVFIRQQLKMVENVIFTYGLGSVIIITAIYIITIKNLVGKSDEKIWIMHTMGYNKNQILNYFTESYGADIALVFISVVLPGRILMNYIWEWAGINDIVSDAEIKVNYNYIVIMIVCVIILFYVRWEYKRRIKKTID